LTTNRCCSRLARPSCLAPRHVANEGSCAGNVSCGPPIPDRSALMWSWLIFWYERELLHCAGDCRLLRGDRRAYRDESVQPSNQLAQHQRGPISPQIVRLGVRIVPEAQASFCRRRHHPRRPPPANIRPGNPAPTMGPGTATGSAVMMRAKSPGIE
jgi:hypothetical protein